MSVELRVAREVDFGFELRRGRFDVTVDDGSVGELAIHETVVSALEPGRHTIRIRRGRYCSRELSFDAADGDVVDYLCHGIRIWPLYVASFFAPSLAISLKRE
ncbi:MAG TPA: hypothetical protein VGP11_00890 [Acidimicrobiales bacterium]|jgi:hypothetical protein|nr:hypothetical protein [Acidimicrobiales bacterium]